MTATGGRTAARRTAARWAAALAMLTVLSCFLTSAYAQTWSESTSPRSSRSASPQADLVGPVFGPLAAVVGPVASVFGPVVPSRPAGGGYTRQVLGWEAGGIARVLVEVAPRQPRGPLALVVVLHGRRQTPRRAERTQHWDALANAGRAVIAYGAGYAGSWNAGSCCGRAHDRHVDDVGYLVHVLQLEQRRHRIDPRRVFLVGFSNGGMLAYRFACAHAEMLSAFGVVDGSLQAPRCHPSRQLSLLDVQGGQDRVVPFLGSRFSPLAGAATTSVRASLRPWQDVDAGSSAVVRLIQLAGVGHVWPTSSREHWDAVAHMWAFFLVHGDSAG